MAVELGVDHGKELGFNWNFLWGNVAVNIDLDLLSYLLSSIRGIMLKDIKPRHIPQIIPTHPSPPCCMSRQYDGKDAHL